MAARSRTPAGTPRSQAGASVRRLGRRYVPAARATARNPARTGPALRSRPAADSPSRWLAARSPRTGRWRRRPPAPGPRHAEAPRRAGGPSSPLALPAPPLPRTPHGLGQHLDDLFLQPAQVVVDRVVVRVRGVLVDVPEVRLLGDLELGAQHQADVVDRAHPRHQLFLADPPGV